MIWLKVGGGMLLIVCGTFAGLYCSEKLRRRVRFYEEYIAFLSQAESMIGYTAASVRELMEGIKGLPMMSPLFRKTLALLSDGKTLSESWKCAVQTYVEHPSDRETAAYFGNTFGTTNCSGELGKLKLQKETAQRKHAELLEEYRTKRRLYRIVGMFAGTLTAVILL